MIGSSASPAWGSGARLAPAFLPRPSKTLPRRRPCRRRAAPPLSPTRCLVGVLRGVELEAVPRGVCAHHLTLAGLAPPGPLCCLCPLKLGELVEDAVCEFPLWALVAPVVEGAHPDSVLLELLTKEVVISGLAGEAVTVVGQYNRDTSSGYKVPHSVHSQACERCPALAGVGYLLEDLVAYCTDIGPGSKRSLTYTGSVQEDR